MRLSSVLVALLTAWLSCAGGVRAADKEVTLKGMLMCASCELKEGNRCQTVLRVKEDDKEVTYYLQDRGMKESYHDAVCGGGVKEGRVTGTVTMVEGKRWIRPSKVQLGAGAVAATPGMKGKGMERLPLPWMTDYADALALARKENKPLALVSGTGPDGWEKLSREGKLEGKARQLLSTRYIPVYLDTNTKEGRHWAALLRMPRGPGLVIGDRSGELVAFRHNGDLAGSVLHRYLMRYADPNHVVTRTETNPGEDEDHAMTGHDMKSAPTTAPATPTRPIFVVPGCPAGCCPGCGRP